MRYYLNLSIRVIFAFLINPSVLYFLFYPITVLFSYLLLTPYGAMLSFSEKKIFVEGHVLNFVIGCIAPSAYYLLTLLVLFTKELTWIKRVKVWLTGALLILGMNLIRILVIVLILIYFGKNWFDTFHLFFWDVLGTVYIFFVWIILIKWFKIKSIPVYDDLRELYKMVFPKKR